MSAGPDQIFETNSPIIFGQLVAYKKLINGDFKINYSEAKKIAQKNGNLGINSIELYYKENGKINSDSSFYWGIDFFNNEGTRELLKINPTNGKQEIIQKEFKIIICN